MKNLETNEFLVTITSNDPASDLFDALQTLQSVEEWRMAEIVEKHSKSALVRLDKQLKEMSKKKSKIAKVQEIPEKTSSRKISWPW